MSSFAKAKLIFYASDPPNGDRAYLHANRDPNTGKQERNWEAEEKEVLIENLRGKEDSATLDTAGFQLFHRPAKHTSFATDEDIYREYYPESIELLKELTGASRVIFFDHTIRRRRPDQIGDSPETRQPVSRVHVDQSAVSSIARVHRHLPATEVPGLLQRRFQIVNLWRPISNPALDRPLALCDYRSVDPETDIKTVMLVYPNGFAGETFGASYSENQKWKYYHGVTPEEVILIKNFDSVQDSSVAVFTPHCSFEDPATPEGTPLRESIELRALVFYD